jgi:AbrB family looped-hinge helix DNA binding protein
MRSIITSRGQTVIPAAIRRRFGLSSATRLEWIVEGDHIRVVPMPEDPIAAFQGQGKGGATRRLLAERQRDETAEKPL